MITTSSAKRIVSRVLNTYRAENRPRVTYWDINTIDLEGGCWQCRDEVENALRRHLVSTQNRPNGKKLVLD